MGALFANNATATLAAGISSGSTSVVVTSGQGALFPSPSGGNYFYATIVNASNAIEIVKVTARVSDTFTVVRAQEGTTAAAWLAGDKIELRITAAGLSELASSIGTSQLVDGAVTTAKVADTAITTAKIVDGAITLAKLATGAVAAALGFTPVKQGGSSEVQLTPSGSDLSLAVSGSTVGMLLTDRSSGNVGAAGYRGVPMTSITSNYTLSQPDCGKGLFHDSATAHTVWVPLYASVPIEVGSAIIIHNVVSSGNLTINFEAGVLLAWASTGATGARTLAPGGLCTVMRIKDNYWVISGAGLS